ncbi:MAG: DegV family protein [Eubacteriales bacterium]|nr:DegV family protein [Eubacteriales bacterium]
MEEFVLSCCSTADRSKQFFDDHGIIYACFHYHIGTEEFVDDLGQSVTFEEFYDKMRNGAEPETSQVNSDEFITLWEPVLQSGKDILHVSLSSGISGVINSANIAAQEMNEKYPDRKVLVVDSLGASAGYGLFMDYLAQQRDQGKSLEEVYQWAEEHKLYVQSWFFSTDLTNYVRGGRISPTSAILGTALGICPLLNVDSMGKLIPRAKIRTKKKVIREIVKRMEQYAENGTEYAGKAAISYSACLEDAEKVRDLIQETFPNIQEISMDSIGTVIGSHTGPGTVALFFMGEKRAD